MTARWTEEEIAALVDGSLDADRAQELQAILEADAEAAALAREVEASNALLRDAFSDILAEPVPAKLEAAVLGAPGKVAVLTPKPRHLMPWAGYATAASVLLAVGMMGGAFLNDGASDGPVIAPGPISSDAQLLAALETLPSGSAVRDTYMPMRTYRDAQGRYCRDFEVRGALPDQLEFGIACRAIDAPDWLVEIVVIAPETEPGAEGYSLASGPGADALDAMLDSLGAGQVMSPDAEAAAISAGWRAP